MFWDLATLYEEEESSQLEIFQNDLLGKGGYGIVCRGQLVPEVRKKRVCVCVCVTVCITVCVQQVL